MRLLRSLLLTSSWLLSFLSAATHDTALSEKKISSLIPRPIGEQYSMGFEVETSGIKVRHDNEDEILVILESLDGKWQLTTDTQDDRIDTKNWVNLECRTVRGLTQEEINKYAELTHKVLQQIKRLCDFTINGEITLSKISYLQQLDLSSSEVQWGSSNSQVINSIILSSKRPVIDTPTSKVSLMTVYDIPSNGSAAQGKYHECFDVLVFTSVDPNASSKIGIEIRLIKDMTPSSSTIEGLKQKLTHEFTIMAHQSEKTGWHLTASKIAHLYSRRIRNAPFFKPALPIGISVTLSNLHGVYISLDCTLRPQLTFSFPISMMSSVFSEVLQQEYSLFTSPRIFRMSEVLSDIDAEIHKRDVYIQEDSGKLKYVINVKRKEKEKLEQDLKAVQTFWASERNKIEPLFAVRSKLNGLCILTAEYILDLFILNQEEPNVKEPGLKPFVKVMSRLSFSGMFNELNNTEKETFKGWWRSFTEETLDRKVKPYKKDAGATGYEQSGANKGEKIKEGERIHLHQWLESISTPINRIQSPEEAPVMRDVLSPPQYTSKNHSMGAVPMLAVPLSHAIIEARGYCDVKIDSVHYPTQDKVSIDNIVKLINDEARKFFALDKGKSL